MKITVEGLIWTLVLAGVLFGCGRQDRSDRGGVAPDSLRAGRPSQVTTNAKFMINEAGHRRAVIRSDQMEQYRTEDSTYSVWRTTTDTGRVHSFVFDEEGDSSATITADSVVFFGKRGEFNAYGNVIVETQTDRRLDSEHLTWNQFDRKIRTDRYVRIRTPTEDVRGNGLVADEDLEKYQIGEFTAEVEVEEEDP